jgi:hypothetical protein
MNTDSTAKLSYTSEASTLEGLDDLYIEPSSEENRIKHQPGYAQGTAQTKKNAEGIASWVTVEEAAKLLNISQNAVLKRLGKAKLVGQKVPGQFGEKWMVDPSGLPTELHVEFVDNPCQEQPGYAQGTARSGKEQPAIDEPSETPGEQASPVIFLVEKIESLSKEVGELRARLEEQSRENQQLKLLTDRQQAGLWMRFCSWMTGSQR